MELELGFRAQGLEVRVRVRVKVKGFRARARVLKYGFTQPSK
jgi:hypothetical protein